jgi:hypothetical protein
MRAANPTPLLQPLAVAAPGPYTVTLYIFDNFWAQAGKRAFNVVMNGNGVLLNFDPVASGVRRALKASFVVLATTSTIAIEFKQVTDLPVFSGVSVVPKVAAPVGTCTASRNIDTPSTGAGALLPWGALSCSSR